MILNRLKTATNARHIALERQLPLLSPGFSRPTYRQFARRFFGYYAPLESQLIALPWWESIGFDYLRRQKTPYLVQDLTAMGDTTDTLAQLPRCESLPTVDSLARLLGCLYVIEGATLGGQIISKHLQANIGVTPTSGCAFFHGYGAYTGANWLAFGKMLMLQAAGVGNGDDIIDSANQTFATLDQWLFPAVHEKATCL
jgi:heme oxygenase (biliverdin-IX-beta and delta-forming)